MGRAQCWSEGMRQSVKYEILSKLVAGIIKKIFFFESQNNKMDYMSHNDLQVVAFVLETSQLAQMFSDPKILLKKKEI